MMHRMKISRHGMKMMSLFSGLIVALLLAGSVFAANQGKANTMLTESGRVQAVIPIYSQKVALQLPDSWKPVFSDQRPNFFIIEFAPDSEKLESWENMLVVQGFENLAGRMPPKVFLDLMALNLAKACVDNVIHEKLGPAEIDGHQSYAAIMGCSKIPGQDKSEIGYFVAIQGEKDLYVVQRSIRSSAFPSHNPPLKGENADEFISALLPIKLCSKGGHEAECKN